ncbi:MAG TPA: hypothetical protein VIN34_09285 [Candidatus Limnocylindria bacterium]|jgi:hypothetical protein
MHRPSLRPAILVLPILIVLAVVAAPASADPGDGGDGGPFRRTTPRADVIRSGEWTLLGIPGGRAWGLESALRPLDGKGEVTVELAVIDPEVREVFLRVAYYSRAVGRSRQLVTADSAMVTVADGPGGTAVQVRLDPPPGAIAYRIRLLGRLFGRDGRAAVGAIRARWEAPGTVRGGRPSLTRLLVEPP